MFPDRVGPRSALAVQAHSAGGDSDPAFGINLLPWLAGHGQPLGMGARAGRAGRAKFQRRLVRHAGDQRGVARGFRPIAARHKRCALGSAALPNSRGQNTPVTIPANRPMAMPSQYDALLLFMRQWESRGGSQVAPACGWNAILWGAMHGTVSGPGCSCL